MKTTHTVRMRRKNPEILYFKCYFCSEECSRKIYPSTKGGKKFCSKNCCNKSLETEPIICLCEGCGITFTRRYKCNGTRFCSPKCSQSRYKINTDEISKEKKKCRMDLANALIVGKIKKRNICEICYKSKTECHHDNYSKPFDFIELCHSCHTFLHKQYKLLTI